MIPRPNSAGVPHSACVPRRACVALCALLLPAVGVAGAPAGADTAANTVATTDTLDETALGSNEAGLLAWADAHSAQQQALQLDFEAARARTDAAGGWEDPEVEIELRDIPRDRPTLLPQDAGSTRYLIKQALPWSGKRALQRRIAGSETDRAASLRDAAQRDLHLRIRGNYARYWQAQRALERQAELESQLATLEALALSRYRSGIAGQQDALKAAIERSQAQRLRLDLETRQAQARVQLNIASGRAPQAALAAATLAPREPLLADLPALQRQLRDTHPALQAESAAARGAELSSQLVRRSRYPDFVLGVAPIQSGSALEAFDVMIGFTLPLQRPRRHAEERAAALSARAAVARRDAAAIELDGALADGWAQRQAAAHQLTVLRDALLPTASTNYEAALAGYQVGRGDLAAVLEALRQANELQQDLLSAQLELQLRSLEIAALTGETP